MAKKYKSKSEELYSQLSIYVEKLIWFDKSPMGYPDWGASNPNFEFEYNQTKNLIAICFNDLYSQSDFDTFFWEFCTLKTYLATYEQRMNDFLKEFIDANNIDFIQNEISLLSQNYQIEETISLPGQNPEISQIEGYVIVVLSDRMELNKYIYGNDIQRIDFSQKRKLDFLKVKLNQLKEQPTENESIEEPENFNDYSDSTDPEKFVMLYELGILDYLTNKISVYLSDRKLASLVSTFTGINKENLRGMIGGTKNKNHNSKITENTLRDFQSKLRELKIDPIFFKQEKE